MPSAIRTLLIAETLFSTLGSKITHNEAFKILLEYNKKNALNDVMRYCKNNRMAISNLEVTGTRDASISLYSVVLTVRPRDKVDKNKVISVINEIDGVISVEQLN